VTVAAQSAVVEILQSQTSERCGSAWFALVRWLDLLIFPVRTSLWSR
jgi:hypothetical protein